MGEWDLALSLNLALVSVDGYTVAGEAVPADDSAEPDPGVSLLFVTLTFGWSPA